MSLQANLSIKIFFITLFYFRIISYFLQYFKVLQSTASNLSRVEIVALGLSPKNNSVHAPA